MSDEVIGVRSEVFERPHGYEWTLWVPGTDLHANGLAPDPAAAYAAMDTQLGEWFPEAQAGPLIVRAHDDA